MSVMSGFNEAAGRTPRKPTRRDDAERPMVMASMRPRGVPRGSRRSAVAGGGTAAGFNEAAGRTPRKPATVQGMSQSES